MRRIMGRINTRLRTWMDITKFYRATRATETQRNGARQLADRHLEEPMQHSRSGKTDSSRLDAPSLGG